MSWSSQQLYMHRSDRTKLLHICPTPPPHPPPPSPAPAPPLRQRLSPVNWTA